MRRYIRDVIEHAMVSGTGASRFRREGIDVASPNRTLGATTTAKPTRSLLQNSYQMLQEIGSQRKLGFFRAQNTPASSRVLLRFAQLSEPPTRRDPAAFCARRNLVAVRVAAVSAIFSHSCEKRIHSRGSVKDRLLSRHWSAAVRHFAGSIVVIQSRFSAIGAE